MMLRTARLWLALTLASTFVPGADAQDCHCSSITDFATTVSKVFNNSAAASSSIIVDGEVTHVPQLNPEFGYVTTHSVDIKVLAVQRGMPVGPLETVRLDFPWAGQCDPNPKLFELSKRYRLILEPLSDYERKQRDESRRPNSDTTVNLGYRYTGTACEIAMMSVEDGTQLPPLPLAKAVLSDGTQVAIAAPLMLIGVEKASRKKVGHPRYSDCAQGAEHCFALDAPQLARPSKGSSLRWDIGKRLRESKSLYVSQIVNLTPPPGAGNATATVLYRANTEKRTDAFDQSFNALETIFRDALIADIDQLRATHVIILSTGWNTSQTESLRNYSDWMDQLNQRWANDNRVRPVYVGWSWPSLWNNPLINKLDYQNKAHDADELGLLWANVLVNKVIPDIRQRRKVRVVLIGHSFGARLLTRGLYSWPLLSTRCPAAGEGADLLIGLQGAFSYRRFVDGQGSEGYPYKDYRACAAQLVLTASIHDNAVKFAPSSIIDGQFIGSMEAFNVTKGLPGFSHFSLDSKGSFEKANWDSPVVVIDASSIIRPPKGHNDVYNSNVAALIADLVARKAPPFE